ncbi:MAG: sugar phosphate isomerase/epimerase [Acidobacteriia bacterium]|nr:sugar phosphate isomerase/epimerase [Terriglobia bacterium]
MTRRKLLATAAAAAFSLRARARWDKSRISAITDEIGNTTDESIAFAHQYGLQYVEIRDRRLPNSRKEYFTLTEPEIKADAILFAREGLKVSFVNTSLMKFTWPGMDAPRRRPEEPAAREKRLAGEKARFDRRMEDLQNAIRCAQLMGCDKVRIFTGTRVQEPQTVLPKVAEILGEMATAAEKAKVYLLIENEMSQNIATSAELARITGLIPSKWIGMNWDPHNAYGKETSFPDGYALLPKKRLLNVQVKGKGVMPNSPEKEDWKAILTALDRDGYKGRVGLETHIFDGTLIAAAHTSMEELMRIVREIG